MTRTAVITGGASGLGRASALRLAQDDIKVITFDIAKGADVVVDVSDSASVVRAAEQVGPIDILVNSAGIVGPNKRLWEISDGEWAKTFAVNVNGTFNLCRAFAPGMKERGWGRIVNFASMAGKEGNPNMSAYSAAKAAVIALTKSLGKELATRGVLVNCITPATFESPILDQLPQSQIDYMRSRIPMGRLGEAAESAALACWLASEECSFSTAATFDISGGRTTY